MHGELDVPLMDEVDEGARPPSPAATRRMAAAVHEELGELDGIVEELLLSILLLEDDDAAAGRALDGQRERLEDAEGRLRHRVAQAVIEREAEAVVDRAQRSTGAASPQDAPAGRRMPATVVVVLLTLVAALLAVGDVTPPLDYVVDQGAVPAQPSPADVRGEGAGEPDATDHLTPIRDRGDRSADQTAARRFDRDGGVMVVGTDATGGADDPAEEARFLDAGDAVSDLVQERAIADLLEEMTELMVAGDEIQREAESEAATATDRSDDSEEPRSEASEPPTDRSDGDEADDDRERGEESASEGDDDRAAGDGDGQGSGERDESDDEDADRASAVSSDEVVGGLAKN